MWPMPNLIPLQLDYKVSLYDPLPSVLIKIRKVSCFSVYRNGTELVMQINSQTVKILDLE